MGLSIGRLVVGPLQVNAYVVACQATGEAIVIDPGDQASDILSALSEDGLVLTRIVGTHAHWDHVLAVRAVKDSTGVEYWLHEADLPVLEQMQERAWQALGVRLPPPPEVDGYLVDGQEVRLGECSLRILHTPGHSPGSVSLYDGREVAFVGDALFAGSIGRTDLPGADHETLLGSIRHKLLALPDQVRVLPGHGPATTIGRERVHNPFLAG